MWRLRSHIHSSVQPRIIPIPEDDEDGGGDSDDSDRNSKMSFSYWGADTITLQKPLAKHRLGPGGIQKEERDKTRDILARIEGLDKVKQFVAPKPSRILVEERVLSPRESSDASKPSPPRAIRGKTSFKRLSDVLQGGGGVGGKKDLWLVVFDDVVLRCQRTGTTSLLLGSAHASSSTNSLPELEGKSKYATTGRRDSSALPRNLYRFIKASSYFFFSKRKTSDGVIV